MRLTVGAVKAETKIIKRELNPEWNQVFAIGRDKIQGGTLELSVWDAVILHHCNHFSLSQDAYFNLYDLTTSLISRSICG